MSREAGSCSPAVDVSRMGVLNVSKVRQGQGSGKTVLKLPFLTDPISNLLWGGIGNKNKSLKQLQSVHVLLSFMLSYKMTV